MPEAVKFLLVDDVEENLVALEALLAREDLELHAARSGVEALELLLVHDYALALIDVQMPGMDGFELAELMRGTERSRHVPIIFVTAGTRDYTRVFRGYESGAVDFLFKPIDPVILRHKVGIFFELWRQRRQLAEQVAERDQLLREKEETLRLNEMFLAALGHDLRNPLNAIMTGATLLARHSGNEQTATVAERILASGSRMTSMIEELLDLARARVGGGLQVARSPGDLRDVVEKVVAEHQALTSDRVIAFHAGGDCYGSWDDTRLGQAVSNLISNALEHGTPDAVVEVRLDGSAGDRVVLTVCNAGLIAPDVLPTLFEPFRSSRSRARRSDGLGLGLYIVRQIVQAHGGDVDAQSPDARGTTTFVVRLPRDTGQAAVPGSAGAREIFGT
jgi:two-component system, sensor histidine kinase and response regulator